MRSALYHCYILKSSAWRLNSMSPDRLLSECVMTFHNALADDTIDRLISMYKQSERWEPARIGTGVLNRTERCCDVIDLDGWAEDVLRTAVQQAYVRYREAFPKAVVGQDYGYKLLRYERNGFYQQH